MTAVLSMLRVSAAVRWWNKDGEECQLFKGVICLKLRADDVFELSSTTDDFNIITTAKFRYSCHKIKSKQAKGRTIIVLFEDGSRLQLSMPIADGLDHGKAVVCFLDRSAGASQQPVE